MSDFSLSNNLLQTDVVEQQPDPQAEEFFVYAKAKIRIDDLIGQWSSLIKKAEITRTERYADFNVAELRQKGDIQEDETFIPDRIIDTNIAREKPDYIAFLKQSHRLAIFNCIDNPDINTGELEDEFTKGLTYKGWFTEFDKHLDGTMLHGWDSIEVAFDVSKPLHVSFEHIGNDNLYFPLGIKNIQDAELIVRRYKTTLMRLEQFVKKFGFDQTQVDIIVQKNTNTRKRNETIFIYKVYFKYQDVVYVGWTTYQDANVSDWLKKPEKLRLGIQTLDSGAATSSIASPSDVLTTASNNPPESNTLQLPGADILPIVPSVPTYKDVDIDTYPIFLYYYKEDEQDCIVEKKGRAFLDGPVQEAATAITTAFVNGTVRASNIYASPANDNGENAEMQQLDVQLVHGGIYSNPLNFFHTEYPDVSILSGLNYLSAHNAQQSGKVNFAVMNRKDSRKTAEELDQAQEETSKISSAGLASYSEYLRGVFSFSWKIVQSQALQNKIYFLLIENPMKGNLAGTPIDLGLAPQYVNDSRMLKLTYEIRPAGDVDFIERQDLLTQMKQDWPVIQNTPIASIFLQDMISLSYPKMAGKYRKILEQGDIGKNLVSGLGTIVDTLFKTHPELLQSMSPQDQQGLIQLESAAKQYLGQVPPNR